MVVSFLLQKSKTDSFYHNILIGNRLKEERYMSEYKKNHKKPCYIEETGVEEIPHKKVLDSFAFYCEREEEYDACES